MSKYRHTTTKQGAQGRLEETEWESYSARERRFTCEVVNYILAGESARANIFNTIIAWFIIIK